MTWKGVGSFTLAAVLALGTMNALRSVQSGNFAVGASAQLAALGGADPGAGTTGTGGSSSTATPDSADKQCPKTDEKNVYRSDKPKDKDFVENKKTYHNLYGKSCTGPVIKAFCAGVNDCSGKIAGSECLINGSWQACVKPTGTQVACNGTDCPVSTGVNTPVTSPPASTPSPSPTSPTSPSPTQPSTINTPVSSPSTGSTQTSANSGIQGIAGGGTSGSSGSGASAGISTPISSPPTAAPSGPAFSGTPESAPSSAPSAPATPAPTTGSAASPYHTAPAQPTSQTTFGGGPSAGVPPRTTSGSRAAQAFTNIIGGVISAIFSFGQNSSGPSNPVTYVQQAAPAQPAAVKPTFVIVQQLPQVPAVSPSAHGTSSIPSIPQLTTPVALPFSWDSPGGEQTSQNILAFASENAPNVSALLQATPAIVNTSITHILGTAAASSTASSSSPIAAGTLIQTIADNSWQYAPRYLQMQSDLAQAQSDYQYLQAQIDAWHQWEQQNLCDDTCQKSLAALESQVPAAQQKIDTLQAAVAKVQAEHQGPAITPSSVLSQLFNSLPEYSFSLFTPATSGGATGNANQNIRTLALSQQQSFGAGTSAPAEADIAQQNPGGNNNVFSSTLASVLNSLLNWITPVTPDAQAPSSCSLFTSLFGGCANL